jgi:hypothetical protein
LSQLNQNYSFLMDKFGKYGNTPWEMTFYKKYNTS